MTPRQLRILDAFAAHPYDTCAEHARQLKLRRQVVINESIRLYEKGMLRLRTETERESTATRDPKTGQIYRGPTYAISDQGVEALRKRLPKRTPREAAQAQADLRNRRSLSDLIAALGRT